MTTRLPVSPTPSPLEPFAQHFDPLVPKRSQRQAFRDYLAALLVAGSSSIGARLAGPVDTVGRYWREWSDLPPPPALQRRLDSLGDGHPLDCSAR